MVFGLAHKVFYYSNTMFAPSDIFQILCQEYHPISVLSLSENTLKLSLPQGASEVVFDSEVHFVSEVSPVGEVVANLTSLVRSKNFTA